MSKDATDVWNACKDIIKKEIDQKSFSTWFEPIVPKSLDGTKLIVQVPTPFFYEWLEGNYTNVLKKSINEVLGKNAYFGYSIVVDNGSETRPQTVVQRGTKNVNDQLAQKKYDPYNYFKGGIENPPSNMEFNSNLKSDFVFDNFIEGGCNRFARNVGIAVANSPGSAHNPLMIYGGVGLGKTHLVHAIGNKIKSDDPSKSVVYVNVEQFTGQYVTSLKNQEGQKFLNFYINMDALIIDDVQYLAGKTETQNQIFNIFNDLYLNGKQIIFTSDRPVVELRELTERLKSRMSAGLIADMQVPEFETRKAIIEAKLKSEAAYDIPNNVIDYIAHSVNTSVRDLEGVVNSLVAAAVYTKSEITLQLAKDTLQNIVSNLNVEVNIDYIQKVVGKSYGVDIEAIRGKTRVKEVAQARQVAMYFCKELTKHTLKMIGSEFGGRDHTTVMHAISKVNDLIDVDVSFSNSIVRLRKRLASNPI